LTKRTVRRSRRLACADDLGGTRQTRETSTDGLADSLSAERRRQRRLPVAGRRAAQAQPGEVLVSSTVKDLVAGSGIDFADRGTTSLKGIPGEWRLFALSAESYFRATKTRKSSSLVAAVSL
jgi:hypothetical protein